jgi:adenine phosphoribosyltransferase
VLNSFMPDLGAERVDKVKKLEDYVINIPDFPKPGIIFRDITSILRDPEGLKLSVHELMHCLEGTEFDVVVGAESRGFLFGMPLAYNKSKGFVPVRKKGKLPRETVSKEYALEYGTAEIEIQRIVFVDDLLATGGTAKAAIDLIEELGGVVVKVLFVMELEGLHGRDVLKGYDVESVITYPGK